MVVPPTIQIASIGIPDTLFLMLLALVVFGPRRLPEIGRQIGKLMYEFRKVSNDFKFQMEEELRASEEADRQAKLQASLPPPAPAQLTLDVPPQPVSEAVVSEAAASETVPADVDFGHGMSSVAANGATTEDNVDVAAVPGEVRGTPVIQPPASGEVVAAAKPFRGREAETVTESGSEPTHTAATPVVVEDEGRVGTEVQPGVDAAAEREAHHA
jgi:sec-independent protein translocase protein TatB